ncbi:MAG: ribonuclease P protein component 1 [Candidatus Aenigmarchaeota archaeon]|nr:ribonuclease P protein component 1 [Candidatus Aenigmarchaeota archaeon]
MISPKNLVRHELIGLKASVEKSTSASTVGLEGKVVDETRQTLTIEVKGKEKNLVKEQCAFLFTIPSGEKVLVDGKVLVARPEDRIKKKLKRW